MIPYAQDMQAQATKQKNDTGTQYKHKIYQVEMGD
jgi:peptide methionine sulfoxide reductase MsrA